MSHPRNWIVSWLDGLVRKYRRIIKKLRKKFSRKLITLRRSNFFSEEKRYGLSWGISPSNIKNRNVKEKVDARNKIKFPILGIKLNKAINKADRIKTIVYKKWLLLKIWWKYLSKNLLNFSMVSYFPPMVTYNEYYLF